MEDIKTQNEKKKEYLRQYRKHSRKIKKIEAEIEEIRSLKMYPSQSNDGMPKGSNQSDLSSYAAELTAKEDELYKKGVEQVTIYKDIEQHIKTIDDEDERDVLFYRYIKGKSFWEISQLMDYSEDWIYKLHGRALKKLEIP